MYNYNRKGKIALGLMGLKGTGKDYIADVLTKEYNLVPVAFGDKLKSFCDFIFDWQSSDNATEDNKELLIDSFINKQGLTYRTLWVEFAAVCNRLEPGVFIRHTANDLEWLLEQNEVIILTDVRSELEIQFCVKNNIPIVKIESDTKYKTTQGTQFEFPILSFKGFDSVYKNVKDCDHDRIIQFFGEKYFANE